MLAIHLQLYSILREKLPKEAKGQADLQMEAGSTLADLLEQFGIKRRVVISVNGEHEPDRSRILRDGDEVKIFSSISGGCLFLPDNKVDS
jgi:sulfur carrier protein ThiS